MLAAASEAKHAHIVFHTEAGHTITFFDARRFGFMDLTPTAILDRHPRFATMGPEPLGEAFTAAHLRAAFEGRRQGAKPLLLDQHVVAGLGNIYVCEALHRARVSPLKPALEIGRRQVARLVTCIQAVLAEALDAGGSSLRDYVGADGSLGYFQHRFEAYDRAGQPCGNRGCDGIIARTVQAGRSTFHCPTCQT